MSFKNYKSISQVLSDFPLQYQENNFIEVRTIEIDGYFFNKLETIINEGVVFNSEYAIWLEQL